MKNLDPRLRLPFGHMYRALRFEGLSPWAALRLTVDVKRAR